MASRQNFEQGQISIGPKKIYQEILTQDFQQSFIFARSILGVVLFFRRPAKTESRGI